MIHVVTYEETDGVVAQQPELAVAKNVGSAGAT